MPELAFVISPHLHYPMRELVHSIAYELGEQGVPSSTHVGGFPEPRRDRVYALVAPRAYVGELGTGALPSDAVLKKTVFLAAERPEAYRDSGHLDLLRRAGAVFDIEQRCVVEMRRHGIPGRAMRPGYSPPLDRFDANAERPIDVIFLGTHSRRRTAILGRSAHVLAHHNCLLQIAPEGAVPGDTSSFLGDSSGPLLARSKVLINLHRFDDPYFEWTRAIQAMHAGAVVVTEPSTGIAPFAAGEHLLVAAPDALPNVVDWLLSDPERLAQLRTQAYERLRDWVPFSLSIGVVRAAIVELVGQPVARDTYPSAALRPQAVPPSDDRTKDEIASVRREVREVRRDLRAIGRQLAQLQEAVEGTRDARRRVDMVQESPAWATVRAPRVTVLTVLMGDRPDIDETLDSLAHALADDLEVVVVAGEAATRSERAAARWVRRHPRLPALVVRFGGGDSLGAARNVAMDFTRGAYCLTLDPGQALYPRAWDVLPVSLDAQPDAAFAYPMVEVVGVSDSRSDRVLSFLGWDDRRLRYGCYIESPALIRVHRLRAVGGFASDVRLAGLEDHDLWCRFAERAWRGQLVPQLLARRTASTSAPVIAGVRPVPVSAMAALAERAPRLLAGALA